MEIVNLADCPEHLKTIVDWIWNEWGMPGEYASLECMQKGALQKGSLPQTYIAVNEENVLMGTISLFRCELLARQDLTPWAGQLYVAPQYRGLGISKQLQNYLFRKASEMGYQYVYCFSGGGEYYDQNGWEYIGDVPNQNGSFFKLYKMNCKNCVQ